MCGALCPSLPWQSGWGSISFWFQSHRAIGSDIVRTDSFWARLAGAGWAVCFYLTRQSCRLSLSTIYPPLADRWRAMVVVCARAPRGGSPCDMRMLPTKLGQRPVLGIGLLRRDAPARPGISRHWLHVDVFGGRPLAVFCHHRPNFTRSSGNNRSVPNAADKTSLLLLAMAAALLLVLGGLTWRQSALYADPGTFWRAALAANPIPGRSTTISAALSLNRAA